MTFWRWLFFLIKVSAVALLAAWIAARPGHVSFVWLGYRVDSSVGVLLAVLLLLLLVFMLLHWLWRLLWRGPRDLRRLRAERKRQQGYRALSQGMAAVAAGDAAEARRQAKIANGLLKDPPLILLLDAQTAQLSGDETAARRYFTAMLERPETAFLGLRGLLMQALKAGDRAEALSLARRAYEERPKTPWAVTTLLDLHLEAGDWADAAPLLIQARKLKALPDEAARRRRAVLLAERARTDPPVHGLDAAREALKLAPDLLPARVQLARILTQAGREREAQKLIEKGWAAAPHPDLASAYAALAPEEAPLARYRRFEKLAALAPRHRESLLAQGEAAIAAGLWGEGRKHLEQLAAAERPSHRLARLMARLEEGERGDGAAIRRWLTVAAEADPDPGWRCARCATLASAWQANCPHCRAFDTLAWQAPPRAGAPMLITPVAPASALPAPAAAAEIAGPHQATHPHGAVEAHPPAKPASAERPAVPAGGPGGKPQDGSAPVDAARLVN
jgi:HemY protein